MAKASATPACAISSSDARAQRGEHALTPVRRVGRDVQRERGQALLAVDDGANGIAPNWPISCGRPPPRAPARRAPGRPGSLDTASDGSAHRRFQLRARYAGSDRDAPQTARACTVPSPTCSDSGIDAHDRPIPRLYGCERSWKRIALRSRESATPCRLSAVSRRDRLWCKSPLQQRSALLLRSTGCARCAASARGRTSSGSSGILLVALVVRVVWVSNVQPDPRDGRFDDSVWYYGTASHLADGDGYVYPLDTFCEQRTDEACEDAGRPARSWSRRRSGRPATRCLLAALFRLPGDDVAAARALNVLAGLALIAGVYYLASKLWNKTAGLLAAAAMAFFPSHIYFSSLLLIGVRVRGGGGAAALPRARVDAGRERRRAGASSSLGIAAGVRRHAAAGGRVHRARDHRDVGGRATARGGASRRTPALLRAGHGGALRALDGAQHHPARRAGRRHDRPGPGADPGPQPGRRRPPRPLRRRRSSGTSIENVPFPEREAAHQQRRHQRIDRLRGTPHPARVQPGPAAAGLVLPRRRYGGLLAAERAARSTQGRSPRRGQDRWKASRTCTTTS